jgi:Tol biopolymer transport system component
LSTLWSTPAGGGAPARVLEEGWIATVADWGPDGLSLVFTGGASSAAQPKLWTVRVGGAAKPVQLADGQCSGAPTWSPSGEWIACGVSGGGIRLLSSDGRKTRDIAGTYRDLFVWSRDGSTLYTVRTVDSRREFGALDWRTGAFRTITALPDDVTFGRGNTGSRGSLNRTGTAIAVTVMRRAGDIWILDGFRPPRNLWERLMGW